MSAVKNFYHDEICNRCPECGVGLSEYDTLPCDSPVCPIPDECFAQVGRNPEGGDAKQGSVEDEHAVGATSADAPNPHIPGHK